MIHAGNCVCREYARATIAEHVGGRPPSHVRTSHPGASRYPPTVEGYFVRNMPHQPPCGSATHASSFHPSSATIRPRATDVLRNAGYSTHSAGSATPNASASTGTSNGAPSSGPMIRPGHATAATSVSAHSSAITWSEQRVDERRDGARLREHDQ